MTDNTQPEALRLADAIKASGQFTNLHTLDEASAELLRQHARIAELEAQLASIVAGGVQTLGASPAAPTVEQVEHEVGMGHIAWDMVDPQKLIGAVLRLAASPPAEQPQPHYSHLHDADAVHGKRLSVYSKPTAEQQAAPKAAPEAIAKLRHLYQNMVNGAVRDTASAKRIAEGLLAPAIEALERATPPAGQQAPVTEGYVQPVPDKCDRITWRGRYYHLPLTEQAAPKAAPVKACVCGEPQASGTVHRVDGPCYVAAPQQEAQEPVSPRHPVVVQWRDNAIEACAKIADAYGHEHAAQDMRAMLTAPQQEAQEPALFVSAKQLADLVDPSHATGGSYLPARKTRAGLFTQPLYTAPRPALEPLSDDLLEALQEIVEDLEQGAIPNANDPWWRKARNAITAALAAQGGE